MTPTKQHSSGFFASIIILAVSAAGALWLYTNQQLIFDQIAVWNYTPTSAVQTIVERAGLSDRGKFLVYASQISIDPAQKFNQECSRVEQSTAVLGCYSSNRIYVYDITDQRLDGIKEVTAAHEMLHAAYQRLTGIQKTHLDQLLEAEYAKLQNNKDFAARMALYAKIEPNQRDNELHSIIGTEVSQVSPELESYYSTYFTDRQRVIALHGQYQALFDQLSARADALSAQLKTLADSINQETTLYNSSVKRLNTAITDFNNKASGGGFGSQAEFNAARSALLTQVRQLDVQRTNVNADIASYQTIYKELQSIASQSDALNRSIDSSLAPAPQL